SWSTTLKLWYLKNTPDNIKLIFFHLKAYAQIDANAIFNPKPAIRGIEKSVRILSEKHKTLLNGFFKYLKGKRYSESTVATYTFLIADFVSFYDARA
ncbi:MAG: integrase, partial [Gelidibacter sp.]